MQLLAHLACGLVSRLVGTGCVNVVCVAWVILLLLQNLVEIFTNQRKICHIFKVKIKLVFRGQQHSLQLASNRTKCTPFVIGSI
jgi:hypothetical protein